MKDWIMNIAIEMIMKAITDDKIETIAEKAKDFLIPFLKEQKDALILGLMAKASSTDTEIDDAVYRAISVFLDSFIPSKEKLEAVCK